MPVPKTPLPGAVRAAAVPAIGGAGEQCSSVDGGVQRQTTTTAAILIPRVSLSSAPTTFSTEGEARCSTGPRHLRRAEGPGGSFSVWGVGAGGGGFGMTPWCDDLVGGGGGGLDFPIHSEHFGRTQVGGEVSETFGNSALGEKPGAPPMGEGLGGWRQGLRTLTAMSYVLTHFTASRSSAYQSHWHSPRATLKNL